MSVAKRDGVSGAGSHRSTRSQRPAANGREPRVSRVTRRGGEEERVGREKEEKRKGSNEEKGRKGGNEGRGKGSRREGGTGLSGQMNRNREVSSSVMFYSILTTRGVCKGYLVYIGMCLLSKFAGFYIDFKANDHFIYNMSICRLDIVGLLHHAYSHIVSFYDVVVDGCVVLKTGSRAEETGTD